MDAQLNSAPRQGVPQQASLPTYEDLRQLTRIKAATARHHPALWSHGRDDLQQEALLAIVAGWPGYDPARSKPLRFGTRLCNNRIADLIRRESAKRRGGGRVRIHLLEHTHDEDDVGIEPVAPDDIQRIDTSIDVREALEQCPAHLRDIAVSIGLVGEARTRERFGLSRDQLRAVKRQIRRHLEDAGLSIYASDGTPSRARSA